MFVRHYSLPGIPTTNRKCESSHPVCRAKENPNELDMNVTAIPTAKHTGRLLHSPLVEHLPVLIRHRLGFTTGSQLLHSYVSRLRASRPFPFVVFLPRHSQTVSEPEEPPKKAVGSGFFGFGAKKLTVSEAEKRDDEQAAPPPGVGTLSARRAAQAKVVAKAAEDEVVVAVEPSKKTGSGFFSFGTSKVGG